MKLVVSLVVLVALAALLAAVTLWQAARVEFATEAAYPPEGQFLTVDGIRMHAVVSGIGPDIVLIHGSSGSVRDFTFRLMPALARKYRVIAVDRPGLGWSDPAPGDESLHVQARLVRDTAAALGATRPIVLGHSYGGAVALAWAVDAPDTVAALVTVSAPSHPWEGGLPLFYQITSNWLGSLIAVPLITAWVPDGTVDSGVAEVFLPQAEPAGYARHFGARMSLRRQSMRENARQRAALKDQIIALAPHYPELRMPVEQVHGTADTTVGMSIHAERLNHDVAGAHLVRLQGIGHMPHQVATDQVVAAVDRAAARAGLTP